MPGRARSRKVRSWLRCQTERWSCCCTRTLFCTVSASPFWRVRPCGSSLKCCCLAAEQNSISDATAATAIGPHDAKSRHLAGEEEVKRCLNGSGMQLQRLSCMGRYGQMRRIMVVAQIALCVVLVGSAARFVRTLQNYYQVDPGFAVDSALAALLLPMPGTPSTVDASYYDDLLRRLEAIPGVRSASIANWIPLGASFKD